jgi:hypothetical protein
LPADTGSRSPIPQRHLPTNAAELVERLKPLRELFGNAAPAVRKDVVTKGLKLFDDLGGPGTTRIPLRVVAKDFVEGEGSLDVLQNGQRSILERC